MQSIASDNAKHCKYQRKALQVTMQSIASTNAKHCKYQRKALRLNNVNYIYLSFCDVDIPIGPGDPVSGELNDAKSNIEYGYEDDTDTPSYIKDYFPWDD